MIGARDDGAACFERLEQGLKRRALEFRQLIEKQDAVVR
jgi:hypothetical protein